jgi:nucleoside transporter
MSVKLKVQLSAMMFLQYIIWGAWYVTMGNYLGKTLLFDGYQIGVAYSTVSIAALISPFFVGMVADRFFPTQKVLAFLHLLGALLLYLTAQTTDFSLFYPLLLGCTLCYMPTIALTNSLSFNLMEDPGKEFPPIRVLGTIGWILMGLTISFLGFEDNASMFYVASACSAVMGLYCLTLPHMEPAAKGKKISIGDVIGLDALSLFKDKSFSVFFISSLLICIPLTFYYNFTNLFLNDVGMENAAAKMTMGQMSETIFMLIMPIFFVRLGVKKMLIVAMVCWAARYVLFSMGNNESLVWMLYAGIILHGICYDFFFVTGQIYVDNKAGEKIKNAAQGLITFATYGLGMLMGSYVSGFVVKQYSEVTNEVTVYNWQSIWQFPAVAAVVVLVIFVLLFNDKTGVKKQTDEVVNA